MSAQITRRAGAGGGAICWRAEGVRLSHMDKCRRGPLSLIRHRLFFGLNIVFSTINTLPVKINQMPKAGADIALARVRQNGRVRVR
jgi:hypothetical protein